MKMLTTRLIARLILEIDFSDHMQEVFDAQAYLASLRALPRHAGHRCGRTVVMRRWMTGCTSSQIGRLTGTGRHRRLQTLRSISASVGDWLRLRF
jgi:hypothetical protein